MSVREKGVKIDNTKRSSWKGIVAGVCGNLSLFIFHPLENVKTRLQANDGLRNNHLPKYNGVVDTFMTMWRKEGLIAFYRGLYINILANALSGGIFFGLYAEGKKRYNYDRETSSIWLTSFISLRAGLITMVCANPVWWIKTRVTLYWNEKDKKKSGLKLVKDTVSEMYKKEGIPSFFRGLSASIAMSFYGVLQMTAYEKLSKLAGIPEKPLERGKTPDIMTFFVGGTSRWIASATLYPVVLMRTRMQKQRFTIEEADALKAQRNIKTDGTMNKEVFYTGVKETIKQTWKNEGIRGFYKGCLPNLIRIFPNSGMYFFLYEMTLRILD